MCIPSMTSTMTYYIRKQIFKANRNIIRYRLEQWREYWDKEKNEILNVNRFCFSFGRPNRFSYREIISRRLNSGCNIVSSSFGMRWRNASRHFRQWPTMIVPNRGDFGTVRRELVGIYEFAIWRTAKVLVNVKTYR